MSLEKNKAIIPRYFEDARNDPKVCDEIFMPVVRFHTIQHASITPQVVDPTPEKEKATYDWLTSVWGDWQLTIDELIAEDDTVMARWTFRGTQQGEYMELPPTNKKVTYSGINIFRIANGRITEIWDLYDRLWLWQQLGVIPEITEVVDKARR